MNNYSGTVLQGEQGGPFVRYSLLPHKQYNRGASGATLWHRAGSQPLVVTPARGTHNARPLLDLNRSR